MTYHKIGYISGTNGLKGDVKIKGTPLYFDSLMSYNPKLYIGQIKINRAYTNYNSAKNTIHFTDFNSAEEANVLQGQEIFTEFSYLNNIDEYFKPLGKEVVIKDKSFGRVTSFFESGKNNYLIETTENYIFPYHKNLIKDNNRAKIVLDEVLYED